MYSFVGRQPARRFAAICTGDFVIFCDGYSVAEAVYVPITFDAHFYSAGALLTTTHKLRTLASALLKQMAAA